MTLFDGWFHLFKFYAELMFTVESFVFKMLCVIFDVCEQHCVNYLNYEFVQ